MARWQLAEQVRDPARRQPATEAARLDELIAELGDLRAEIDSEQED